MGTKNQEASPSYQRRQALRDADAVNAIRVLDSYPLHKYFDISQRLLDAFQKSVDKRELDQADVYGLRFAAFGVEALPKHKDWRLATYNKFKRRNAKQVDKVISMMEILKARMDAEEVILQEQRRIQEQQEAEERRRKEVELAALKQEQAEKAARQRQQDAKSQAEKVGQSAMAKLQAMQSKISSIKTPVKEDKPKSTLRKPIETVGTTSTVVQQTPQEEDATKGAHKSKETAKNKDTCTPKRVTVDSSPASLTKPIKRTPRSSKEQATIDLLDKTIRLQEERLNDIETRQIPALLVAAKGHLRGPEPNRNAALQCVARKRALLRHMDVVKAAIFNMETQMFMLENVMEDRELHKALKEASQAMDGLQQSVGDSAINLTEIGSNLPVGTVPVEESDEELLDELQEWIAPEEGRKEDTGKAEMSDDDISILSLPTVPASPAQGLSNREDTESEEGTVSKLLKAVLG